MSPDLLPLILRLRAEGAQLRAEGDRLKIAARKDLVDAATLAVLKDRKAEVLQWLARLDSDTSAIPRADLPAGALVPATEGQQGMWLLAQRGLGSAYHIAAGLLLEGDLDRPALRTALQAAATRHASLRTRLVERDGRLEQAIDPPGTGWVDEADRHGAPPQEQPGTALPAQAQALLQAFAEVPFDLASQPPLRARLVRLAPQSHALLLCVHHSAIDGWGLGLLLDQLGRDYAAAVRGEPPALAAPVPDLVDLAVWQRRPQAADAHAAALAHWLAHLAHQPPPLRLAGREAPAADHRAGQHLFELPAALAQSLHRLAADSRITLYHWLLAAWRLLLAKYAGSRDVSLLVPVANRDAAGLHALVGLLANTVPSVGRVEAGASLRDLAEREAQATLQALPHHATPFEQVVRHCRAHGIEVPAQVLFSLQTVSEEDLRLPGLRTTLLRHAASQAKFDLTLTLEQRAARLTGVLEYRAAVLEPAQAAALAQAYVHVLGQLVAAHGQPMSQIALCPADRLPGAPAALPNAIEQIAAQVRRTPEAPAVCQGGLALTYAQLWQQAAAAARALQAAGVQPGDHVGLLLPPGPALVVGALAALAAGAAYAPLDPAQPEERLAHMVQDAQLRAVLALPGQPPMGPAAWLALPATDAPAADAAAFAPVPVGPRSPAYLIFTSGSTGRPKAARVHQRGLAQLLQWYCHGCVDAHTRALVVSNPSFDLTQKNLLAPLTCGALVAFPAADRFDPLAIAQALRAHEATLLNATPTAFQALLAQAEADDPPYAALQGLCTVVLGGEPIPLEPLRRWQRARAASGHPPAQVINSYGPTECSDVVAWEPLPLDLDTLHGPVPIGSAVPGCVLEVVDLDGQPLPAGAIGELRIDGDCVGLGYVGRDDLTRQAFVPGGCGLNGWRYLSGDLVRQGPDGRLLYLGRRDQQVKFNGYRIEPGEIESALLAHEALVQAAVAVRRDAHGHAVLAAFYATRDGQPLPDDALRRRLARVLAPYQVPARYVHLEALPLTRSGKVDRNALPQALPAPAVAAPAPSRALTADERILVEVWQQLLATPAPPGPDDDFFALGGHSMLALQMVAALRQRLDCSPAIDLVFRHPVLHDLALALRRTPGPAVAIPRLAESDRVALTPMQQRLWFLFRLDGPSAAYNMASAFRLQGALDPAALRAALGDVVERHWILRSTLAAAPGEPLPRLAVGDPGGVPIETDRCEAAQVSGRIAGFLGRPFDLACDPLSRFALLQVPDGAHYLLANIHHIACDGVSLRVLFEDLAQAYAARGRGATGWTGPCALQFAELAAAQGCLRDDAAHARALAERVEALRDAPQDSSLPPDAPRGPELDRRAGRAVFELPAPLGERVRGVAATLGTTPFCVLLASWFCLLARYRRQDDLLVGVPVACRDLPGSEAVIGPLLNTLVVRVDTARPAGFAELVARTAAALAHARERRAVPFEDLVEAINPPRHMALAPLFQVQFVLDPVQVTALALEDLDVRPVAPPPEAAGLDAKYDINVHVVDADGMLHGYIDYRRGLYREATVRGAIAAWQALLEAACGRLERPLDEIGLLDASHLEAQLAMTFTADATLPHDLPVHRLFERQAARTPQALAVDGQGEPPLTYAELDACANRLAHRLIEAGAGANAPVAVAQGRGSARIISLLAILKAGAAYLPVDPEWPQERRAAVLAQSRCRLVVADDAMRPALGPTAPGLLTCVAPYGPADESRPATAPAVTVAGTDLCYVMFTSGSTGVPKGVPIRHGGVAHDLVFLIRKLGLGEGDRVLQLTSFSFDPSVRDLFATLGCGATAVMVDDESARHPARILERLAAGRATHVLSMVPTLLRALVAEARGRRPANALRVLMLNGERLRGDDCARARAAFGAGLRLVNQYGPTEATMTSATHEVQPADLDALTVPLGRPNPNTLVLVMDAQGQPLPFGAIGEIWIAGPGLSEGYLDLPQQTAAAFVAWRPPHEAAARRFYRTGDLGRWRSDGVLEFLGRVDFQVKLRGHRIELGEIDACLGQQPGIAHCASTLHEDAAGRQWLCAFYTAAPAAPPPDVQALKQALARRLPPAMVPAHFIELPGLPLTSSGKVDRRRLPDAAPWIEQRTVQGGAPADEVERQIAEVWMELLGLARAPSREANFFEFGANSLSVVQARDRLAARFGNDLGVVDLFQHASIAALATHLGTRRQATQAPVSRATDSAHIAARRREQLARQAARRTPGPATSAPVQTEDLS